MHFPIKETPTRTIYNMINGLVAPRPIALVTSQGADGRLNAAPFSSYNYLSINPPILGFGVAPRPNNDPALKDTARNIEQTKEYVIHVVTEDIGEKMNVCGVDFPPDVSELDMAGFTTEPSLVVKVPRIKEAHAALECRLWQILTPGTQGARIILGEVVAIYIEDRFLTLPATSPQGEGQGLIIPTADQKAVGTHGPYVLAEELHSIGRMNGLSKYVHTRDAFMNITRMNYEEWQKSHS